MSLTKEMAAVLAEQHFAALAAGDAELAARCIHPANVNHMAADEPPACATPGIPGFLATSAWLRLAFSDLSFEIIELTADAGRTMAHVRMSGRQTGPFVVFPPGAGPVVFAPTGLAFGARQVHVFRHRDGQHGEHIAVRDDLAMMTQLGHLPPSPRAAWRMARTALTGYRARAVREAIRVSADAAAGVTATVPSGRSLRAAPRASPLISPDHAMPAGAAGGLTPAGPRETGQRGGGTRDAPLAAAAPPQSGPAAGKAGPVRGPRALARNAPGSSGAA